MQKVYLLLRNNQQTGPHSLEELLQLNLKPFDLVWVEGKSYGWSYPSEVENLKPFVAPVTQETEEIPMQPVAESTQSVTGKPASNKKIFVSLPVAPVLPSVPLPSSPPPVDSIEQRAEALRRRTQSYMPQSPSLQEEVKTNYTRKLDDIEEDYTSWVFQKKTKKKSVFSKKNRIVAGIIAVGLAGGWWAGTAVFHKPESLTTQLGVQANGKEEPAAMQDEAEELSSPVSTNVTKSKKQAVASNKLAKKEKNKKQVSTVAVIKETAKKTTPVLVQNKPVEQPEEKPVLVPTEEKTEGAVAEAPKQKRKSLKQILGGLFKKNKNEESAQGNPKPADNNNNERNATRRDEETAATIDLADQVDVKMNKAADDWMMGVQDLKLTVYNRSNATLKDAAIEVLYYSDQNDLLQKKTLHFSNIGPKKSQTLPAPDHRLADHVDYKILSASGVEDAYVKQ
jgi:hypothetical protein